MFKRMTLVGLAVLLVGATWPPGWVPEGKQVVKMEVTSGEIYDTVVDLTVTLYDDGTAVWWVARSGESPGRAVIVDHDPEYYCAKFWQDAEVLVESGGEFLPLDEWGEPRWVLSRNEDCPET